MHPREIKTKCKMKGKGKYKTRIIKTPSSECFLSSDRNNKTSSCIFPTTGIYLEKL